MTTSKSKILAGMLGFSVLAGSAAYSWLGKERETEQQYCRFDPVLNKEMFEANRAEQAKKFYYKEIVFHEGEREAMPLYGEGWPYDAKKYPIKKYHWRYTQPGRIAGGILTGLAALLLQGLAFLGIRDTKKDAKKPITYVADTQRANEHTGVFGIR